MVKDLGLTFSKRFTFKRKCCFCGVKEKELLVTIDHETYYDQSDWPYVVESPIRYHAKCRMDVLCEPERYDYKLVDKALQITTLIQMYETNQEKIREQERQDKEHLLKAERRELNRRRQAREEARLWCHKEKEEMKKNCI